MSATETDRFQHAKDQLLADFRAMVADAEELLQATAGEAGGKASAARAKIQESLEDARRKLAEVEMAVAAQARDAVKTTDALVHEHPWRAVGIAAAAGFLLGMLIQRR